MGKMFPISLLFAVLLGKNVQAQLISASSAVESVEAFPITARPEPEAPNSHKASTLSSSSSVTPSTYSSLSRTSLSASLSKGSLDSFSGQFFDVLQPNADPNFVASPFSVETIMSLLYCGADGETANIMQRLIFINGSAKSLANEYHGYLEPFQNNKHVHVANCIFIRNGYQIQSEFQQIAQNDFYSTAQSVNFANQIAAANQINNYVANETNNQITNLVQSNQMTSDTEMILVNALHFKGQWTHMFSKQSTKSVPFFTGGDCKTSTVNVSMMSQQRSYNFGYINYLDADVIELPFTDSAVSMYIYLPKQCNGIDYLEKKLKHYNPEWMYNLDLRPTKIILSLPKFRVESSFDLKNALTKLGVVDIFSPRFANFDRLAKQGTIKQSLYVGQVLHKAVIDVNEIGVEASAATAVRMLLGHAFNPTPPTVFTVNRPFVFSLATPTNVLFVGRYTV